MHVKNLTCYNSAGIAIGSLGQYEGVRDVVENITAEDVTVSLSVSALHDDCELIYNTMDSLSVAAMVPT